MKRLTKRYTCNGKPEISVDSKINGISCSNFCTSCGKADCEDIRKALFKLAEYEDLEEQKKLLRLPCKAGQKAYLLRKDIKRIIDGEITSITISEFASGMRIFIVDDNRYTDASFDKIREIVFFTQEEAEAALKEL